MPPGANDRLIGALRAAFTSLSDPRVRALLSNRARDYIIDLDPSDTTDPAAFAGNVLFAMAVDNTGAVDRAESAVLVTHAFLCRALANYPGIQALLDLRTVLVGYPSQEDLVAYMERTVGSCITAAAMVDE